MRSASDRSSGAVHMKRPTSRTIGTATRERSDVRRRVFADDELVDEVRDSAGKPAGIRNPGGVFRVPRLVCSKCGECHSDGRDSRDCPSGPRAFLTPAKAATPPPQR
jgi:hypothetical protein